jgi:predicted DNA-binding transcriptional regulator
MTRYGSAVLKNECAIAEDHAAAGNRQRVYGAARNIAQVCAGGEIRDEEHAKARLIGVILATCDPRRRREMARAVEDGFAAGLEDPRQAPSGGRAIRYRGEVIVLIGRLREWVATSRLSRRANVVVYVFCDVGEFAGKLRFSASYRELAEWTGLSVSTIRLAVKELVRERLVRIVSHGNRFARENSRSVWQLLVPMTVPSERNRADGRSLKNGQKGPETSSEDFVHPVKAAMINTVRRTYGRHVAELCQSSPHPELFNPSHDVWHRRHTAWRIYRFLASRPEAELNGSEIARLLNISPRTTRENLRWLESRELAARGFAGWLLHPEPPVPVAEAWAEKRRARHKAERDLHKRFVVARDEAKEGNTKASK